MTNRIQEILQAVEKIHGCNAKHDSSQVVMEQFRGQAVWDGIVEVFNLTDHPTAKRCYAWSFIDNGEPRYVTVLELPPVSSPSTAVRVAIASGQQFNNKISGSPGPRGKKFSPQTRRRQSLAKRGERHPDNRKDFTFVAPDGRVHRVHGVKELCKKYNLSASGLSRVANHRQKSTKGRRIA